MMADWIQMCNFAPRKHRVDRFGLLATTEKNAKTEGFGLLLGIYLAIVGYVVSPFFFSILLDRHKN